MEGPPLGPGGEDITWPDQVAPRSRKASSTRKIKPQTSNLVPPPRLFSIFPKGGTLFGGADCPQKPADRKGSPSFAIFFRSTGTVGHLAMG